MSTTAIVTCKCESSQQDDFYGKGKRLANKSTKSQGQENVLAKCTVCGTYHTVPK